MGDHRRKWRLQLSKINTVTSVSGRIYQQWDPLRDTKLTFKDPIVERLRLSSMEQELLPSSSPEHPRDMQDLLQELHLLQDMA